MNLPTLNLRAVREFNADKRGAVMLTGLCMSLFLIGSLWFLIGIGDAILFRDHMQEVSDSSAYTSAAVHAKGMNFISMCNIILLLLFVIHIIMGIVHDVLLVLAILGFGIPLPAYLKWKGWWNDYAKVMKQVGTTIHYMEFASAYGYPIVAAYQGYKVGVEYEDASAVKRKILVVPFSTSLIPGNALDMPLNKIFKAVGDPLVQGAKDRAKEADDDEDLVNGYLGKKKTSKNAPSILGVDIDDNSFQSRKSPKAGLPVVARANNSVCGKIGREAGEPIISLAANISGSSIPELVAVMFQGELGALIQFRYCNPGKPTDDKPAKKNPIEVVAKKAMEEALKKLSGNTIFSSVIMVAMAPLQAMVNQYLEDLASELAAKSGIDPGFDEWWGEDGPYLPWPGAPNGSPWHQVFAMNVNPEFEDTSARLVALASRNYGGTKEKATPKIYWAQSEFYFDCASRWSASSCNGRSGDDNAGYALRWRARLRRLDYPAVGTMMTSYAFEFLTGLNFFSAAQGAFSNKAAGEISKIIGESSKPFTKGVIGSLVSQAFGMFGDYVRAEVIAPAGKALDPRYKGSYH